MRRYGPAIIAAVTAVVLLLDQVSKHLARTYLEPGNESIRVVGDLLRLTFTRNEGAAFGMLPGNVVLFIPVHILVVVVIAGYVWHRRPERPWLVVSLGLVAGGALGNLIDRVVFGWVTDFIQVPFDFPIFNIADSAVVVGVGMLVWWLLFGPESREPAGGETGECESTATVSERHAEAAHEEASSTPVDVTS